MLTHIVICESANKLECLERYFTSEFCGEGFAIQFTLFESNVHLKLILW